MEWEIIKEGRQVLPVALGESELAKLGHDLGVREGRIQAMQDARREAMAAAKAGIDKERAEATAIAKSLATKSTETEVEVSIRGHFASNTVHVVRLDTLEVVEERAMTQEERTALTQKDLPIVETKRRPAKLSVVSGDDDLPAEPGEA